MKVTTGHWFDTGDWGMVIRQYNDFDHHGRAKDTIVLTNEKIEPQPIEGLFVKSLYRRQIHVSRTRPKSSSVP